MRVTLPRCGDKASRHVWKENQTILSPWTSDLSRIPCVCPFAQRPSELCAACHHCALVLLLSPNVTYWEQVLDSSWGVTLLASLSFDVEKPARDVLS